MRSRSAGAPPPRSRAARPARRAGGPAAGRARASAPSRITPPAEARTGGSGRECRLDARDAVGDGRDRRRTGSGAAPPEARRPPRSPTARAAVRRPAPRPRGARRCRRPRGRSAARGLRPLRAPPGALRGVGLTQQLLDGVPPRRELDRVEGRMRQGLAQGAGAERRARPVHEREEAALAAPSEDSKSSSVAIADGIEAHPRAEARGRRGRRCARGRPGRISCAYASAARGRRGPRVASASKRRRARGAALHHARPSRRESVARKPGSSRALGEQDLARPEERERVLDRGPPSRRPRETAPSRDPGRRRPSPVRAGTSAAR